VIALPGSTTTEQSVITTADGVELVLRRYSVARVLADDPAMPEREVAALGVLATSAVPAPRLVEVHLDHLPPSLLMTLLPGRVELDLPSPPGLRRVLDAIHAVDAAPIAAWRYRPYLADAVLERPVWWPDDGTFRRAASVATSVDPGGTDVFLHRDFHPGNVLWLDGEVSGVVDWSSACVGPAAVDVAHCRVNLALQRGSAAAEAFDSGDPAWDVRAALDFLPWAPGLASPSPDVVDAWPESPLIPAWIARGGTEPPAPFIRERLIAFVYRALARLKG
jgi:aminoglycoside phosphotransferase (APT) family kinase protein